jgi:hypothetical protein
MSPREIQMLNSLDRRVDGMRGRLTGPEINTYRRLLIRFVEDAFHTQTRLGLRSLQAHHLPLGQTRKWKRGLSPNGGALRTTSH